MNKDILNIPRADTLMGSLRSMGYTFEAAVADVIDNSITAGATEVSVLFPKKRTDDLSVAIVDNGCGMSETELIEAMRYGSSSVDNDRDEQDLGRFGMGMKSASLSQCRNLIVLSYDSQSNLNAFQWDYDYILQTQEWIVQKLGTEEINQLPYIEEFLQQSKGTMVLWQDFDVLFKSSQGEVYEALIENRDVLIKSLSLIFHRFIGSKFALYINNYKLEPIDPFLENHPKTTLKKEVTIAINDSNGIERYIYVKPYVLPFGSDLSKEDQEKLGGIENLRTKQGFYIYRNKRLIVWGTWFRLRNIAELTKYARIRVDIPNTLDDIWKIDIKKQNASIPKSILNQLKQIVETSLDISVKKQTYRGRVSKIDNDIDYIWDRIEDRDNTFNYRINRKSQLFKFISEKLSDEDFEYVKMFLKEIESNIPIQQIYIDKTNESVKQEEESDRVNQVYDLAHMVIDYRLRTFKELPNISIEEVMKSEPFCNYPDIEERLHKEFVK